MRPVETRTHELAAARVRNALLGDRLAPDAPAAVRTLLAVQAQEPGMSRWSVGQRLSGQADDAAVRAMLDDGQVVRTHVLRPTWHYVAAEDLRWLQALTGERVARANASWYRNHGIDDMLLGRSREVIVSALAGGRSKTRDELKGELTAAGLDVEGQRMAAVLMDAELRCLVCSGPLAGGKHTYALADEWIPAQPSLDPEEAAALLVERYLRGHAPATLKDLRWWSTLTLAQLRAAVDELGDAVVTEEVGGATYLWHADDPPSDPAGGDAPRFQLLQVFDELFVGYSQTRGLLDPDGEYGSVLPIGYSRMMHVVVEGDRLVGRWRSDRRGGELELSLELSRPLGADDRAELQRAAARYGAFVGRGATALLREDSTR